ncbi:MAG: hypothetical protein ABW110_06670, partial [Steroidobacteraceae bacterium]
LLGGLLALPKHRLQLGDLELDRSFGPLLHSDCAFRHTITVADALHTHLHKLTRSELAIDV